MRVARGMDDVCMALAIRAAVFVGEEGCAYAEEFDGNDACALHVLCFVDGEPAGTLRLRFFAGFAKLERVAMRREFRGTGATGPLVDFAMELVRDKGFSHVYGHIRRGMESFWTAKTARYGGFRRMGDEHDVSFSGISFTAMVLDLPPSDSPLGFSSGPDVLNRPEGDWARPGVLEASARGGPPAPG